MSLLRRSQSEPEVPPTELVEVPPGYERLMTGLRRYECVKSVQVALMMQPGPMSLAREHEEFTILLSSNGTLVRPGEGPTDVTGALDKSCLITLTVPRRPLQQPMQPARADFTPPSWKPDIPASVFEQLDAWYVATTMPPRTWKVGTPWPPSENWVPLSPQVTKTIRRDHEEMGGGTLPRDSLGRPIEDAPSSCFAWNPFTGTFCGSSFDFVAHDRTWEQCVITRKYTDARDLALEQVEVDTTSGRVRPNPVWIRVEVSA